MFFIVEYYYLYNKTLWKQFMSKISTFHEIWDTVFSLSAYFSILLLLLLFNQAKVGRTYDCASKIKLRLHVRDSQI